MEQTPAFDRYNPDLLDFLPKGCARVLEIGCSTGALARAYKLQNPTCRYLGVEIDLTYAEAAKKWCDQVLVGNIETMPVEEISNFGPVDCIIFGDVLEHLYDPWAVLRRIHGWMTPDARVVACIPNMQHWSIQARINMGDLEYEDMGLLDRTHIRWFTRRTILSLFESAGFHIESGVPRIFNEADRDKYLPVIRAMAAISGIDPEEAVMDSMAFQYMVLARPIR